MIFFIVTCFSKHMNKKKNWLKKYILIIAKLIKIDFEYDSVRKKLIHANDTNIILYGYGILISIKFFLFQCIKIPNVA
jgi:hypothetical protein